MNIRVYSPTEQASGSFDGGTITEQKPIGFPGEGSAVTRIGPLFYWAWAQAPQEGYIGSHPHQAFEIMTYVIQGKAIHGDSLGSNSTVGPGGAQVIQAGSGVSHNERLVGPNAELFQIWLEPYIREALKRPPAYNQYDHEVFPTAEQDGVHVKTILGEGSPIQLVADSKMWDITIQSGSQYTHTASAGHSLALLAFRGDGSLHEQSTGITSFSHKDFVVVDVEQDEVLTIAPQAGDSVRIALIEVPTAPDYPLYPKRR